MMANNTINMAQQLTEVVHHTGTTFRIYLTDAELLRTNTDPEFANELAEKYYELYQQGLVRAVETESVSDVEVTPVNVDDDQYKIRWTDNQIKFLISLYRQHFVDNNKSKGKKTNKALYIEMAKQCKEKNINVSWQQIETKIKGLLKIYKNIKDNDNSSGRGSVRWQYYDVFEEFMGGRPEVLPPAVVSNINCETSGTDNSQSSVSMTCTTSDGDDQCITPKRSLVSTRRVATNRKRNCSRSRLTTSQEPEWFRKYREDAMTRHKERMEVLQNLTNILKDLTNDNQNF